MVYQYRENKSQWRSCGHTGVPLHQPGRRYRSEFETSLRGVCRAHEANVEKIIEDIGSERRAHRLIEGLVQKFSLIGCGYFAQEDVERELEREMSVRDYEQLKEDLASYHDFEATRHKSLETILGETI